jgi:mitochondrial fission protein ELM1
MGLQPEMKIIALKKPWAFLPNIILGGILKELILTHMIKDAQPLTGPYPDVVISCGRKGALVCAALKLREPKIRAIHIQDPQMPPQNFDVVVAMQHDRVEGKNVIKTLFALHNISPEKLEAAQKKFAPDFEDYPKPHIAVLLGGSTNKYKLTEARMADVIKQLEDVVSKTQGSLLITPSRRTGTANIEALKRAFSGNKRVFVYDGKGQNPYIGMLACADKIIVSNDSVNMMSEAFSTGKPVTIMDLQDHKNTKPYHFGEMIKSRLLITGDEMEKLAQEVRSKLWI